MEYIIAIVIIAVGVGCFFGGVKCREILAEKQIGTAEAKAREIVDDALKAAEARKREVLLEAKEEAMKVQK